MAGMGMPIERRAVHSSTTRLLALLHLASPALPVGAFAWSQGMGGAVEQGIVHDEASLCAWLEPLLRYGLGRWDAPLALRCAYAAVSQDMSALRRWNALSLAGRESAELYAEEVQMGKALCRLLHDLALLPIPLEEPLGWTAAFGLAAVCTEAYAAPQDGEALAASLLWSWLENQTAAASKAVPLGQTVAQRVLLKLLPVTAAVAAEACCCADDDLGVCLHGLALVSTAHEQQYSRMFRS